MVSKTTFVALISFLLFAHNSMAQEPTSQNDYWIGQELWYKYTGGMEFHVKFEKEGMSYQALSKSKPDVWWGPFPFNSLLTDKGEYLLAWYEEGYGDYVTLLIDPKNKTLYGSAIIALKDGPKTHLQPAKIYKMIGEKE